jgi:hypothetical protein
MTVWKCEGGWIEQGEPARCAYRFRSAFMTELYAHQEDNPRPPTLNSRERVLIEITLRVEYHGVQDHVDERLPHSEFDQLAHRYR